MTRLPNQPYLLTLHANFLLAAKKDVQAARTQLQLAQKASPGLVESGWPPPRAPRSGTAPGSPLPLATPRHAMPQALSRTSTCSPGPA
jgi:hypothetical protein